MVAVARLVQQVGEHKLFVIDPQQFYLGLMAETARRPTGSGLGLARVRAEADMDVSCVVDGDQLEIVARVQYRHEA